MRRRRHPTSQGSNDHMTHGLLCTAPSEFVKGDRCCQRRQRRQRYGGRGGNWLPLALLQLRGGQDVELPLIEVQRVDGVVIFMGQESEHIEVCLACGFPTIAGSHRSMTEFFFILKLIDEKSRCHQL